MASNADFGGARDSHLSFTPSSSGTFFLAAGAFSTNTGSYQLAVST